MDKTKGLILFVDDQEVARKYFSLMFGAEYDILTASSAEDAWLLIQEHGDRLAVVITDQRMGQHTGVDLLMAVRQKHPRIVRLLTTGYADLDEAIDAVQRGDLHAYIQKPWNIDEFGVDIRRAMALYDLQCERDTLIDMQARAFQHALASDRLRTYGLIAATASGWIEHPLAATLAFWADCLRHNLNRVSAGTSDRAPSPTDPWTASGDQDQMTIKQTRAMIVFAAEIGTWLAAHRGTQSAATDAGELALRVAEEEGIPVRGASVRTVMPVDAEFLSAGLRALIAFFTQSAALEGREAVPTLAMASALDGGLDITVRWWLGGRVEGAATSDGLRVEMLGLKGYLAIHHHGGAIAIQEWGRQGVVTVHLPPLPPAHHVDETADFAAALRQPQIASK